jgi:hypothetical protein
MKYQINVVQQLRQKQKREQTVQSSLNIMVAISLAFLIVSLIYAASRIMLMNLTLEAEKNELARIEAEYGKYKATRMIVDKSDIELLDKLQTSRVYWTKKLAAMALHLPNLPPNPYWITAFSYNRSIFNVKGYGIISPEQEQLITIDDYLNNLRKDSSFSDVFTNCYLNATVREDDGPKERVSFDFSAEKPGAY